MEVQKDKTMDIQRCFEILELDPDAGADDAKLAYKDLVNIWHPDRFSSNPRLQKKAGDKLRDINIAYETIRPVLSSRKTVGPAIAQQTKSVRKAEAAAGPGPGSRTKNYNAEPKTDTSSKTEAFVEAGTGLVLNVFASLYSAVRSVVKDAAAGMDLENSDQRRQNDTIGNKCRRRDRGNGRGMGGRRGGGRGGGKGRGRR